MISSPRSFLHFLFAPNTSIEIKDGFRTRNRLDLSADQLRGRLQAAQGQRDQLPRVSDPRHLPLSRWSLSFQNSIEIINLYLICECPRSSAFLVLFIRVERPISFVEHPILSFPFLSSPFPFLFEFIEHYIFYYFKR